jgi:hypothetical protein
VRPLKNTPFCPISASGSNFNPRNTQCIPVVKIFAFLELKQNLAFFKGLISIITESGYGFIWIFVINTISTHQIKKILHILLKFKNSLWLQQNQVPKAF